MANQFIASAIQMVSSPNLNENLLEATHLINCAVKQGTKLVVLPECFGLMNKTSCKTLYCETIGEGVLQSTLCNIAKHHQIWIVGGTLPLKANSPHLVRNSTLLFSPNGSIACRYDKIHLFSLSKQNEQYTESKSFEPGKKAVAFKTPLACLAFGICYDIRFPELFRNLLPFDILVIPAAFIETTGKAHWEVLLRARAIENQCYVIASAQGGFHKNGRITYGHSMIIDPWGHILAKLPKGQGVISQTIDLDHLTHIRQQLPALQNRSYQNLLNQSNNTTNSR
jgi:nitrilase